MVLYTSCMYTNPESTSTSVICRLLGIPPNPSAIDKSYKQSVIREEEGFNTKLGSYGSFGEVFRIITQPGAPDKAIKAIKGDISELSKQAEDAVSSFTSFGPKPSPPVGG